MLYAIQLETHLRLKLPQLGAFRRSSYRTGRTKVAAGRQPRTRQRRWQGPHLSISIIFMCDSTLWVGDAGTFKYAPTQVLALGELKTARSAHLTFTPPSSRNHGCLSASFAVRRLAGSHSNSLVRRSYPCVDPEREEYQVGRGVGVGYLRVSPPSEISQHEN